MPTLHQNLGEVEMDGLNEDVDTQKSKSIQLRRIELSVFRTGVRKTGRCVSETRFWPGKTTHRSGGQSLCSSGFWPMVAWDLGQFSEKCKIGCGSDRSWPGSCIVVVWDADGFATESREGS